MVSVQRAPSDTVLRAFYDFHRDTGSGPILNPFAFDRSWRDRRGYAHRKGSPRSSPRLITHATNNVTTPPVQITRSGPQSFGVSVECDRRERFAPPQRPGTALGDFGSNRFDSRTGVLVGGVG